MVQYGRPVVPLERNLYGHHLAGMLWERQFEKILLKYGWEKVSNWECLFVHREKGNSYLCMWMTCRRRASRTQPHTRTSLAHPPTWVKRRPAASHTEACRSKPPPAFRRPQGVRPIQRFLNNKMHSAVHRIRHWSATPIAGPVHDL